MNRINIKPLIFGGILLLVFIVSWYCGLLQFLSIESLREHMTIWKKLVAIHYYKSLLFYFFFFLGAMALCLPGSSILMMAGGMLFGLYVGFFSALGAATGGSIFLFLISRYFLGDWIQSRYAARLREFNNEITRYGHYYLLLVRLIAVFPFSLVNLFSGLTVLSLKHYIGITMIGLVPISLMYTFLGAQLSNALNSQEIFVASSSWVASVFLLFKIILAPPCFNVCKRLKRSLFI